MAFAVGSRHALSFVAESTYGTTPGTPSMKLLRQTGNTIGLTKETFLSDEIRSNRERTDLRHGTHQVGGDVPIELSYGAFDDFLAAALFSTWSSDVLKVGTTVQSFTMERRFLDIAQYQPMTGCMVNTLALNIQPNAMVTGTIGIIGQDGDISGTSLGTPTDVATNAPFDSFTGALLEGGSAIASVSQLSLNLTNNITPAFVIGSKVTPQMIYGMSDMTGSLTAFFEDENLMNKFLNEEESSLAVTLTDPEGNDLEIDLPRIKYTSASVPVNSANEGVTVSMDFQALLSSSDASSIVITRTPAA